MLGWQFEHGSPQATRRSGSAAANAPGAVLCFRVEDIAAGVARVRAAGGTASDPEQRPYALESECVDDQETPFYLHQFAD